MKIKDVAEAIPRLLEADLHPDDANLLRVALPKCLRRLEAHAQRWQKVVQQLREKPTEALRSPGRPAEQQAVASVGRPGRRQPGSWRAGASAG
ncbi:hypothetical protein [Streptomyces sp. NPDC048266]|uniref:hypothetical protein n=1 Tax=Streptomyces sp. NPDC048266 TaxID=3155787 RepID=UPI0033F866E0